MSDIDVYQRSPQAYLEAAMGWDVREALDGLNGFSFGPAAVDDELFVCPDCHVEDDVVVEANTDDSATGWVEATCPNCSWSHRQDLGADP